MNVYKFGGASVKDADGVRNVANIIQKHSAEQLVVVVSAMGKMTNALEAVAKAYFYGNEEVNDYLAIVKEYHNTLIKNLFDEVIPVELLHQINDFFVEIEWILEEPVSNSYDYLYDQIVSIGEFVSTTIIFHYLQRKGLQVQWLDIRDLIRTDNHYRKAKVDFSITKTQVKKSIETGLNKADVIVTQGFIGGTFDNETTTLGREGSDYTVAVLAHCLEVDSCTVWKDVPGVLSADPREFVESEVIPTLSYSEATEMSYYGAKVLHPKTIQPLVEQDIVLFVRSFENPDVPGTTIRNVKKELSYPPLTMIRDDQVLLELSTTNHSFLKEKELADIFDKLLTHKLESNMMKKDALKLSICMDNIPSKIEAFLDDLKEEYNIVKIENLQLNTIRYYDESSINKCLERGRVLIENRTDITVQLLLQ